MGSRFEDLFDERRVLLEDIYLCTKEIDKALAQEKEEDLLAKLEQRQGLMEEVDSIDKRLEDHLRATPKALMDLKAQQREILQKVLYLDDKNRERAQALKGIISSEIRQLKKVGEMMAGYGFMERPSREGAFIDTKE